MTSIIMENKKRDPELPTMFDRTYMWVLAAPEIDTSILEMLSHCPRVSYSENAEGWDRSRPVLVSNSELFQESDEDATFKTLILVQDPVTYQGSVQEWAQYYESLMDREGDCYVVNVDRDSPRDVAFNLIGWCPDLWTLDYGYIERVDAGIYDWDNKALWIKDQKEVFNEICEYYGYPST